jgi:glycosyltransferase involved in cell wall biosynthesis
MSDGGGGPTARPALSVVTPAFDEAANLPLFHERLVAALGSVDFDWEWVVIDDHSRDGTFRVASALARGDPRIRVFRLARNVGSHAAIACGLDVARGRAAAVLAADLEDPPALIPALVAKWRAGVPVVWAVRRARPDRTLLDRLLSRGYTALVRGVAGLELPPDGADCVLLGEPALGAVRDVREHRVPFFPLVASFGLPHDSVAYDKEPRMHGRSGWTFARKVGLVTDSLTALNDRPIRWAILAALAIGFAGFAYAVIVIANYAFGAPVEGWSSLMVAVLVLNGLQLLVLGIVGAYVWRTLEEVRRRPRYEVEAPTVAVAGDEVPTR